MAPVLTSLKMLNGYREAELVAARVGASKMGFFTSPQGDGFTADDKIDNVPIMQADPGTFHQLPEGVNFQQFDPTHPTGAFAEFEKAVLRGIASGLGVSYTSLANNLEGVSYSSIRQGTLEDRDQWKMVQDILIQHFVEPVFREFLMSVMENGVINIPSTRFDKFADAAIFRARGFQWVDPLKEMNAAVIGMKNGILSMQDVANQYGRDVEETFSAINAEKELAAFYGLKLAFEPFGDKLPTEAEVSNASGE
jgi:lambda family phage portal protein